MLTRFGCHPFLQLIGKTKFVICRNSTPIWFDLNDWFWFNFWFDDLSDWFWFNFCLVWLIWLIWLIFSNSFYVTPYLVIYLFGIYFCFFCTKGPIVVLVFLACSLPNWRAYPKSLITACFSAVNNTLRAAKSRWTIPTFKCDKKSITQSWCDWQT